MCFCAGGCRPGGCRPGDLRVDLTRDSKLELKGELLLEIKGELLDLIGEALLDAAFDLTGESVLLDLTGELVMLLLEMFLEGRLGEEVRVEEVLEDWMEDTWGFLATDEAEREGLLGKLDTDLKDKREPAISLLTLETTHFSPSVSHMKQSPTPPFSLRKHILPSLMH